MTWPECVEVIQVSPSDYLEKYSEQIGKGASNQYFNNLTPDATVFVALSAGSPVGYALVKYSKKGAELYSVYVIEAQRKKRVAQKLVVKALQEIENKKCPEISFTPGHDETGENGLRQVRFFNMIYNEIDRNPKSKWIDVDCIYDREFVRDYIRKHIK